MRNFASLILIALLGCADPAAERDEQSAPIAAATESSTPDPAGSTEGPAPQQPDPQPPQSSDDEPLQCGADKYRYLIGKPRREIPKEPTGASWRITCTSCAITQDYSPGRLNIFYDEGSGIVKEVRCG